MLGDVKRGGKRKDGTRLESDRELCTLCGGCVPLCPYDALTVHETLLDIDEKKCTACGACAPGCPTGALKLGLERDALHFSAGSYTTAGAVVLDRRRAKLVSAREDLRRGLLGLSELCSLAAEKTGLGPVFNGKEDPGRACGSSGSVRLQGVEAPDLSPGSSCRAERGSR